VQGGSQEFVTAAAALVADVLARFGRVQIRALGTSMTPTIQSGDILDVEACADRQLSIGDIVLVGGSAGLRAHRIVDARWHDQRTIFVTRGDAHWRMDAIDSSREVLGRVVAVSRAQSTVSLDCPVRRRLRGLAQSHWTRVAMAMRMVLGRIARTSTETASSSYTNRASFPDCESEISQYD
jgi:hypothetical protein